MVAVADLRAFVNAGDSHDDYLSTCIDQATYLVDTFIGDAEVPAVVADRARLEAAAELYHRKNAHGSVQVAAFDGTPQRIPRDPMSNVYALLRRFVGPGLV